MPLIWALNLQGACLKDRVYGPYLMRAFFEPGKTASGLKHFLFGSTPETLEKLEKHLSKLNPQTIIVGHLSPPFGEFSDKDEVAIAKTISDAEPDCIWVALGGIKQETWIKKNLFRYRRGVFLGVGDAFSLLAGQSTFAPATVQRLGLTWLFRMIQNPRRLGPRYFTYNFRFLKLWMLDRLKSSFSR